MSTSQKNITLGTAGHIDHGKTALIKCLTGCDTDHLKAEKERGMSIDLGFAPCTVSGLEVGIVDVPGHENFIKTMVAGASGIDGAIFVIAADDGVMPQTREHLDILTLLGVKYGVVALTKVDCVEPERVQNVTAEIKDFLVGTFLEDAPILPVSGVTGQGFDVFYEALQELVGTIEPKRTDGVFRLPVERTFSVKGYGTVVTGIPVAGTAKIGDEMVLFPHGTKSRLKAIQVYKRDSEIAMVGQCAALNVPQWDYKTIKRGNVVTLGEFFQPQQWYLCKLRVLPHIKSPLKNGTKIKFHTGTSEIVATVYLLEESRATAGSECLVQVRLDEPVVAAPRDRFILRTLSPVQTIGGGIIVEALSEKLNRKHPQTLQDVKDRAQAVLTDKDFAEYCIKTAEAFAVNETKLSIRTKILPERLKAIIAELVQQDKVLYLDSKLYIHTETADNVQQQLLSIVSDFHHSKPESPGLTIEQLLDAGCRMLDARRESRIVFDSILKLLISQGKLVERKHRLALPEHRETFSEDEQKLLRSIESLFRDRPFNPPKYEEVIEHTAAAPEKVQKILQILIEQERLIRVAQYQWSGGERAKQKSGFHPDDSAAIGAGLLFHSEAIEQARQILVSFINKEGRLESVKFKYLLDTTRKFAIPLLDYFDRVGVTRREGYTRYLKSRG
ncbi:MAG: selenocysteine-specific translation elongation factor [Planctomycetes bacterium]|nr:selenocysteine-specific translation elongation factor [Planctomycetota bacterium]